MCCLVGAAAIVGPRFALAVWWIFGNKVELAFDTSIWPLLGLIFAPWTALAYVLAWQPGGLDGNADIVILFIGIGLDIVTWGQRFAAKGLPRERSY
jgi:hypothetical protein